MGRPTTTVKGCPCPVRLSSPWWPTGYQFVASKTTTALTSGPPAPAAWFRRWPPSWPEPHTAVGWDGTAQPARRPSPRFPYQPKSTVFVWWPRRSRPLSLKTTTTACQTERCGRSITTKSGRSSFTEPGSTAIGGSISGSPRRRPKQQSRTPPFGSRTTSFSLYPACCVNCDPI